MHNKKERTTIRSFNVILSFSVRRDVPWHVSTSPPCSRAQRRTKSKLKRVHKIERGVLGKGILCFKYQKSPNHTETEKKDICHNGDYGPYHTLPLCLMLVLIPIFTPFVLIGQEIPVEEV